MSAGTIANRKDIILTRLCAHGQINAACKSAGVSTTTFYNWCARDADFALACKAAREQIGEKLEAHAIKLALTGTKRPVVGHRRQKDGTSEPVIVGWERHYPTDLIRFLLAGYFPGKYGAKAAARAMAGDPPSPGGPMPQTIDQDAESTELPATQASPALPPERRLMFDRLQKMARGEKVE